MTQQTGEPAEMRRPRQPPGTLRVGQIGGIAVLVRSSWLLVAALISVSLAPRVEQVEPGLGAWSYVAGLAFAVLLYLSVLLHEASHALMARHYGLPVSSITLHFLGGVTQIDGEPDTARREFGVSVVGPLTSIAVGLAVLPLALVTPDGTLLDMAVKGLAWVNLVVGVLNLVPGLPLDGGHVLRAAVWQLTGNPHRGTLVAGAAGRVVAVLVLAYPFLSTLFGVRPSTLTYVFAFVIAWFLWSGATSSMVQAKIRRRLPALRARTLARRALSVPHDLPLAEAVRRAQQEQAGSIVVLDATGAPTGVVNESAVLATPDDRRPWLPVSAVARSLESGLSLPADLAGEQLLLAMQRTPATEYVLLETGGGVFGVLVTDDVDRAFAAGA